MSAIEKLMTRVREAAKDPAFAKRMAQFDYRARAYRAAMAGAAPPQQPREEPLE